MFAYSNLPSLRFWAPVNAPFSKPKSSLSSSSDGSAAQLTLTKGLLAAAGELEEGACDELLAGAALAAHQHGDVGVRHLLDDLRVTSRILRVVAARISSSVSERARPRSCSTSWLEGALLQRLLEGELELLHLERLAQEVGCAEPHGLDDVARLTVAGEHHHGHIRQLLLQLGAAWRGHRCRATPRRG